MQTIAIIQWYYILAGVCAAILCLVVAIPLFLGIFYSKEFQRLFESAPPLQAKQIDPTDDECRHEFESTNGRRLVGGFFRHRGEQQHGLIIFCHEFTGNRHLFQPYVDYLRDDGFDIFAFDFSNHGESETIQGYQPLQWVTDHEVADVTAAVNYAVTSEIAPAGKIGLLGVSKGGSAAIVAAAGDLRIKAVVTDGAFPTHSLVTIFVRRWIDFVVSFGRVFRMLPQWMFSMITRIELFRIQRRRNCRFPFVESCFQHLAASRPLLLKFTENGTIIFA